jgi:hypothetical protein
LVKAKTGSQADQRAHKSIRENPAHCAPIGYSSKNTATGLSDWNVLSSTGWLSNSGQNVPPLNGIISTS